MKKKRMILKLTAIAMLCFCMTGMEAKASGKVPLPDNVTAFDGTCGFNAITRPLEIVGFTGYIDSENFDYVRYADEYPELKAVYGYDRVALFEHYACQGQYEGRIGRIDPERIMTERYFDYERYANDYPDIAAVYGMDKHALYTHYMTVGKAEGRKGYSMDNNVNAQQAVYEIIQSITNASMSERDKVKAVHDWICANTAYDYESYLKGTIPLSSSTAYGLLTTHKGVCAAYADTFKLFMDLLEIDAKKVTGKARGGAHAWNQVKVDGVWYSIDVTWDDPVPDKPGVRSYKYFLISNEQMALNHVTEKVS